MRLLYHNRVMVAATRLRATLDKRRERFEFRYTLLFGVA